jgi:hypothetical protein
LTGYQFVLKLVVARDWRGFVVLASDFIPYTLMAPTFDWWFGVYSFARLHDTCWGNRPDTVCVLPSP